ncbi:MAG: LysE family transporter [Azonexus sp.]|jgi:threonine/homoserine/homoserine lactone efflux protein|nr:LysE family transporter [Azonexus sp.]
MFGVSDYSAFVIAVLIFLAIPGPGNLALLTSTAKGGVRGGLAATAGVILGDQVLMWLAVAGVAAALAAHPSLFNVIQWAGAAYLAWLGARMLFAKPGAAPILDIKPHHYLRQAMMITLLNPKAIVFYMAFFPLFVDPQNHLGLLTFAFMAASIALLTLLYCITVIALFRGLGQRVQSGTTTARLLEKLAGIALIGFGAKLLTGR